MVKPKTKRTKIPNITTTHRSRRTTLLSETLPVLGTVEVKFQACSQLQIFQNPLSGSSILGSLPSSYRAMEDFQCSPFANETAGFFRSPSTTKIRSLYRVFINHRGIDSKKSLASLFYWSLQRMGLSVFLDSRECDLGDHFPDAIQEAIRSSSVHIAILSKNYAHSAWCLAELALMLKTKAKIVPVFYHILPSVPRYCTEVYAEAFRQHESKGRYSKEQIEEWKSALHEVSFLQGASFNEHDDDLGMLWNDIVGTVLTEMKRSPPLKVAEHPVGLEQAVYDFNVRRERKNNPKLVVIVGMCGSGKTTLAKELFNRKHLDFDASCFLYEVRAESAKGNLVNLQREMSKMLLKHDLETNSVSGATDLLRSHFARVEKTSRFLIILDDIDHKYEVDALLVGDVLQTDSLIIITSRDRSLFTSCRPEAMLYEMKKMDEKHARELFCWHAFNQSSPVNRPENEVDSFVRNCDGLPLMLEEVGALLRGKADKEDWKLQLRDSTSKVPNEDIKLKLKTSYDPLEEEEKQIFLDSSCFFVKHPKKTAIQIWDASGWKGEQRLETLKYKSLIEVHHGGTLIMHDLFRYLGRDLAKDIAPADPNCPRRLWKPADIEILERRGFQSVLRRGDSFRSFLQLRCFDEKPQILYSNSRQSRRNKNSSGKGHSGRLVESKVHFFLGNDYLGPELLRSSSDLLWLKWEKCPHKSIPSWIPMKSLRHLEIMGGDLERLWRGNEDPWELRELIIQCNPLTALPMQLGSLTNLQYIDLFGCDQLETLPESFSCLEQLQYLDLSECGSLTIAPYNLCFGQISETESTYQGSLRTLRLLGTTVNEEVLNQIVKLKSLESLTIGSDSLTFLPSVRQLSLLTNLTIRKSRVQYLPEGIGELTKLQSLEVEDCPLTELTLTSSKQRKLGVLHEETVYLSNAAINNLHSQSDSSIQKSMLMLSLENITLQNTNVTKISISGEFCPSLKILNLKENKDLVEVYVTLLSTLECLFLSGCSRLKRISGMSDLAKLKELEISGCCELVELSSLARLSALERFTADKCWKLQNTGGVELLQGLKDFRLLADNGAIWNCFRGLKRLPPQEMILGGRAVAVAGVEVGVEWISLSPSDYPDGRNYVIGGDKIRVCSSSSTTSVVMIACFVIESFSEDSLVRFWGSPGVVDLDGAVRIRVGEWIIASVFVIKESSWKRDMGNLESLQVLVAKSPRYELKKAFIARGGEDKITETLNKIFCSNEGTHGHQTVESNFKLQEGIKA